MCTPVSLISNDYLHSGGYVPTVRIISSCLFIGPICRLVWDPLGRYFASCGGNDKHIRVWHNAPGYRAQMADCKNKIFNAKSDVLKV